MLKTEYNVIGVMSGTSLDGIDLIHVTFKFNGDCDFINHSFDTVPYSDDWKNILKKLTSFSLSKIQEIDSKYTSYLAKVILEYIDSNNIKEIDAVCSHGHTALHQPENGMTYQIGNRPELASLLNQKVVCDFRVQDVKFGGQGAPLVPIGDQKLFSEYDFCLNLGGFANISYEQDGTRIAFDICPVNIVLNYFARQVNLPYDKNGQLSKTGKVNLRLLELLNELKFYSEEPPKSLGLEWVEKFIFQIIADFDLSVEDILRTFVEHAAIQITNIINKYPESTVLITGGGVFNLFLIERITSLTDCKIIIPKKEVVEYKEALIFGLLGVLKLRNEVNCLSSVTGAKKDHSSGIIYKNEA